ncbi:MAG: glycosyltransferase [Verrucomicrobiae bacterium]|nr:glycosyltransferase [Verrucomicrobiae bacterium]
MKIAIVAGMFPKISETFIVNQITGLIDRGHEVTIIASEKAEKAVQSDVVEYQLLERTLYPKPLARSKFRRLLDFAIDWLRVEPRHALASLKLAAPWDSPGLQRFYFWSLFQSREFDLIHCHFGFMGRTIADFESRGLLSSPLITSFHGVDIGSAANCEDYRLLHTIGTRFTVNSQFSANRAIELGCPADRIELLPVGVNLPAFRFSARTLQPNHTLRLLTVGRLIKSKGIHIALEAVAELANRGIDIHYDIVGDGPERIALERQAREENVTFHGALLRPEVVELFEKSHIFVLPSLSMEGQSVGMEGQGLVLQEAQAMGLPVIASRCCGIPEGIIEGESGLLFKAADSSALVDCILELRDAHKRWADFGKNGRALVERKFDIEKLNDRLVSIYQDTALVS